MSQMWASKNEISERIFTCFSWFQDLQKNKLNLFLDGMAKWPKKKKKKTNPTIVIKLQN